MQRRSLLLGAAAASAALAAPALRAQTPSAPAAGGKLTPLRFSLDFRVTGQTAPFFLALQRGWFRDEGLDVAIDVGSGSVASITRVASGAYDMSLGDVSALIEFNAANPGTPYLSAVYQYYNRAPFVIVGRRDRGVTEDFRSLQGKRIAAAAVESTRRAWPMVARRLRLAGEPFAWVTTDFSQRDNVIVRGDVDGATYFHDSAVSLFQRLDPKALAVLPYTSAGVDLYGNAVLASNRLIVENPRAVAGFLRALNRAIVETLANPAPAIAAAKAREPLLDERTELARWAITAQYVAAADTRSHGLGDTRQGLVERQVDEVVEVFGLKARPSAAALFNRSFLPPRAEREVRA